jgi:hypothetical protein
MAIDYPQRQGFLHSLKSVEVYEGPELYKGVTGVKWSVKIEDREAVYGTGVERYGQTRGHGVISVEIEFEITSAAEFIVNNEGILMLKKDIVLSAREAGSQRKLEFIGLTFDELDGAYESGPSKLTIPGTADKFLIDGKSVLIGDALGQSGSAGAS